MNNTYAEKIANIDLYIKQNGIRSITGPVLNVVLKYILDPNAATIDTEFEGEILLGNVYTKEQSEDLFLMLSEYTNSERLIKASKIEPSAVSIIIPAAEHSIEDFILNHTNYTFEQNDFIAIPNLTGDQYALYAFIGGLKTNVDNYLPTGLTSVTIAQVQGLQAILNELYQLIADANIRIDNLEDDLAEEIVERALQDALKANKDASNLSPTNVISWRDALDIYSKSQVDTALALKLDKPTTDGSWVVTKSGSTITYTDASTFGQNISNSNLTWSADRTQNLNAKKLSFTGGRVSVPALELEITAENSVPNKIWTDGNHLSHTNNLGISYRVSYDNQVYKGINSDTTLDDSFHNTIVWITGNCIVTVPNTLRADFTCVFDVLGNYTATFLEGGTTTFSAPYGKILRNNRMCTISKRTATQYRLNGNLASV